MTSTVKNIYLAGPDVFLKNADAVRSKKLALCTAHGFHGLHPLDNDVVETTGGPKLDRLVYDGNITMMRACDAAIFNLTAFRGPGADDGTAFELGFLSALNKPCFGYVNDILTYWDRVTDIDGAGHCSTNGRWHDADGRWIENFGNSHNLMIAHAIEETGYPIFQNVAQTPDPIEDLAGFVLCLGKAQSFFNISTPEASA